MAEDHLIRVRGIGAVVASRLNKAGIKNIEQLASAQPSDLAFVKGIGVVSAKKIITNANHLLTLERGLTIVLDKIKENFVKSCPKCGGEMKEKFIIVHGANAFRDRLAKDLGIEKKIVKSVSGYESVFSDKNAIDIMMMSYAGLRNKRIVELLNWIVFSDDS